MRRDGQVRNIVIPSAARNLAESQTKCLAPLSMTFRDSLSV